MRKAKTSVEEIVKALEEALKPLGFGKHDRIDIGDFKYTRRNLTLHIRAYSWAVEITSLANWSMRVQLPYDNMICTIKRKIMKQLLPLIEKNAGSTRLEKPSKIPTGRNTAPSR